jgi:hypothetical protein
VGIGLHDLAHCICYSCEGGEQEGGEQGGRRVKGTILMYITLVCVDNGGAKFVDLVMVTTGYHEL